ncbi:Lipoprotein-releasing system transmembrane protein lolC [Bacteroidales bacterium CF]|nr:Lipoprotein-releasing system transmembrane protein lolC [Bacteroidales bacterium CF]
MNINLFIAKTLWRRGDECKKGYASSNTLIAQVSVVVSFLVIILSIVISDGFKYEIKSKASGFSGDILLKSPGVEYNSNLYPIYDNFSFRNDILSVGDVKTMNSYAYRSGMIKYNDQIQGVVLKGVDAEYDWGFFKSILSEGELPDFSDTTSGNQAMISLRLAEMMGLKVGDEMPVYFIDQSVRVSKFMIKGVFDAQLEQIDRTLIITDIKEVQRLNGWGPAQVSGVEIQLSAGAERAAVADNIQDIVLEKSNESDSQMEVTTVDDLFPHLFDWLRLLDFNVMIVLALMMLVAGFNMLSGLLILLFEKISVIGLLKALGMRNMNIHGIFMYKGFRIVLSGMIIGNITAMAVAILQKYFHIIRLDPENYFVKAVPIHFDFLKIATIDIISVIVIMSLMLLPSLFVSRVSPDRTIRVK